MMAEFRLQQSLVLAAGSGLVLSNLIGLLFLLQILEPPIITPELLGGRSHEAFVKERVC